MEYEEQLETLDRIYRHVRDDDGRTFLEILGRSRRENLFSRYLAYFLDDPASLFDGAPLKALLSIIPRDLPSSPTSVRVTPEYTFSDNNRIDLIVEIDESVILGIENKIDAAERKDQTTDYWEGMLRDFPGRECVGVLLSPDRTRPLSDDFDPLGYRDLHDEFRNIESPWQHNVREGVFWVDFLDHIERHIIGRRGMPEMSESARLYLEYRPMIDRLVKSYDQYVDDVVKHIVETACETLKEHDSDDWSYHIASGWKQIFRPNWKAPRLFVHYEFIGFNRFVGDLECWFVVDVEFPERNTFLDAFESRHRLSSAEYDNRNIEYRPSGRTNAIAQKRYPLAQTVEQLVDQCADAVNEFRFLTPLIEETFAEIGPLRSA